MSICPNVRQQLIDIPCSTARKAITQINFAPAYSYENFDKKTIRNFLVTQRKTMQKILQQLILLNLELRRWKAMFDQQIESSRV